MAKCLNVWYDNFIQVIYSLVDKWINIFSIILNQVIKNVCMKSPISLVKVVRFFLSKLHVDLHYVFVILIIQV